MASEPIHAELLSIVGDVHEHLHYLQELGVEQCEKSTVPDSRSTDVDLSAAPLVSLATPRVTAAAEPTIRAARTQTTAPPVSRSAPDVRSPLIDNLFGELSPNMEDRLPVSAETFEQISQDIGNCTRCALCEGRTHVVHTDGNKQARLMFVGEAPGADEDAQARPFVGRAGQLLTKIIEAIGLKREEVLIGNVNRCRPPGNRPPTPEEAATCKPFLLREIAVVRPEVIVVLGNTAMKNLLGTKEGITRLRGIFQDYKGIKVMPTFHPAYLLRDPSKKRETWEDLKKVRDYLDSTADRTTI